jgi:hypothetical protein
MTRPMDIPRPRYLSEPARMVRRVLAPAALELEGQLPAILEENAGLRARLAEVEGRLAELEDRLAREVGVLQQDLLESRRLNLRVAELTDLVTELVLPLHDREIDPSVLVGLAADAL